MLKINIQMFGGRGQNSSGKRKNEKPEVVKKPLRHIGTFTGAKNYEKARENGYVPYRGDDLDIGGFNYVEIANKLLDKDYKVRVFESTTRVRGLHDYTILYKRKG